MVFNYDSGNDPTPIRREYPATSALRIAVSLRWVPFLLWVPLAAMVTYPFAPLIA